VLVLVNLTSLEPIVKILVYVFKQILSLALNHLELVLAKLVTLYQTVANALLTFSVCHVKLVIVT